MSALHRMHRQRGEKAAVSVDAYAEKAGLGCAEAELQITFLIWDLGHLCDREGLDFVDIISRAVSLWKIEQTDPTMVAEPPKVTVAIEQAGGSR
jgi:hypothetical protein